MTDAAAAKRNTENINVIVRCRPMSAREIEDGETEIVKCSEKRKTVEIALKMNKNYSKSFYFDAVFGPEATQRDVYQGAVAPIVEQVLMGYNCTIFAYGQTGTGKTYTMEGKRDTTTMDSNMSASQRWKSNKDAGIIARAVYHIFDALEQGGHEYSVRVSHLELYNEELCDLLNPQNKNLKLYEDASNNGRVTVHNLEDVTVYSPNDIFNILERSWEERRTAETLMNKSSSRSHCIFSITIHIKEPSPEGEDLIKIGKLNLVDLAGSENIGRSGADKIQLRRQEASMINKSLLTLGRVITALTEGSPHVPYRESKLTRLLQDSLGGTTKTCIIATVSPASGSFDETMSTLDYAFRAKNIKNRPEINQKMSKREVIKEYNHEISQLRAQLDCMRRQIGVYLPTETYNQMEKDIRESHEKIQELEHKIEQKQKELLELQELFDRQSHALDRTEKKLSETQETLEKTTEQLKNTEMELEQTKETLDEHKYILLEHQEVESKFHEQGQVLLETLSATIADIEGLFSKIDRKDNLEMANIQKTAEFRDMLLKKVQDVEQQAVQFVADQTQKYTQLRSYIDEFVECKSKEIEAMTKSIQSLNQAFHERISELEKSHALYLDAISSSFDQTTNTQAAFANNIGEQIASFREYAAHAFAGLRSALQENQNKIALWTQQRKHDVQQTIQAVHEYNRLQKARAEDMCNNVREVVEKQLINVNQQQEILRNFEQAQREEALQFERKLQEKLQSMISGFFEKQREAMKQAMSQLHDALSTAVEDATTFKGKFENMTNECIESVQSFDADLTARQLQMIDTIDQSLALQSEAINDLTAQAEEINNKINAHSDSTSKLVDEHTAAISSVTSDAIKTLRALREEHTQLLNTASDVVNDGLDVQLTNALREHQTSMETFAQTWSSEIAAGNRYAETFAKDYSQHFGVVQQHIQSYNLQHYQPTGETPKKKVWQYPTNLEHTRPYSELMLEYHQKKKNSWVPPTLLPPEAPNSKKLSDSAEVPCGEPPALPETPVDSDSDSVCSDDSISSGSNNAAAKSNSDILRAKLPVPQIAAAKVPPRVVNNTKPAPKQPLRQVSQVNVQPKKAPTVAQSSSLVARKKIGIRPGNAGNVTLQDITNAAGK